MTKPNRYPLVLGVLRTIAPDAVEEFRFATPRKWRADYAIPSAMILIEVHGGAYSGGRHTRGAGYHADLLRSNAAACLGYRMLCYTPQQARTGLGDVVRDVRECMKK